MKRLFVYAMMFACCCPLALAGSDNDKAVAPKDSVKAEAPKDSVKAKKPDAYEKLIKEGGSERDGLFLVRHIKNDWYVEVPDSLMGRLLLAVTRFKAVPQGLGKLTGEEVNTSVVYWEQYDNKTLLLREYAQTQYAPAEDNIYKAVEESTVDPILGKFEVIGRNPNTKAQLVNISKQALADNKLFGFTSRNRTELSLNGLAPDRSMVDTIKTFPQNISVVTVRTYSVNIGKMPASKGGAVTLKLNTSIVLLPEEPMRPRYADERVGYFETPITLFSDEQQVTDKMAITHRYRLEPKDEARYRSGKLTEPKKQIVYYIDPATPKKWVPYLIAGVEDWNKAFEAAGFKNAITAKEWPDDETMDIDDARFSVIRYLPSEKENAYGPCVVDPRSGEIMESHVCWYHNVMNLLKKWYMVQCGTVDKRARTMTFSDELMGTLIRFVSSHEVGHTLGLRHNMMASSATPVEKLRDKAWVEAHGHTISIMDYARFNYVAQPEDNISPKGLFPRIGDYDLWAIYWGYKYRPEYKDAFAEKKALRTEVTRKLLADHRLMYVGDEGMSKDPRDQMEDLGDNSMKAGDYGIKNLKRVMEHILEWTAQPDGDYTDLSNIYNAVCMQYGRYVTHVNRNVGGVYHNTASDLKPEEPVPASIQKEAVDWYGRNVLTPQYWLYPEEVTSKTGHNILRDMGGRQTVTVSGLLTNALLKDMNQAAQYAAEPYKLDEYLNDVFAIVWKPFDAQDETGNYFIRQNERTYVTSLCKILKPTEAAKPSAYPEAKSDVPVYVRMHLDRVKRYIEEQRAASQSGSLEAYHYDDLLQQIGQAIDEDKK